MSSESKTIGRMRDRIERLRGLCKSASGWLLDAGDTEHSKKVLDMVGDMEADIMCDCGSSCIKCSLPQVIGHAYSEEHWKVNCPKCDYEMEYQDFFDSGELYCCELCSTTFKIERIVFDDDSYIT